jgi:hypothetical protein
MKIARNAEKLNLMKTAVTTSRKVHPVLLDSSYLITKYEKHQIISQTLLLPAAIKVREFAHGENCGRALTAEVPKVL